MELQSNCIKITIYIYVECLSYFVDQIISSFAENFEINPAYDCPSNCDCHKNCRLCLTNQYYDQIIDYSCNNLRMMYVLRYLYVHSSEMYFLFKDNAELIFPHLNSNILKIRSIGAGPGLELFGFLRFICDYKEYEINQINLQRVESVEGWNEIYTMCYDIFKNEYSLPDNLKINKKRNQRDVFQNPKFNKDCNILIYSYFWSEHLKNDNCIDVWRNLSMSLEQNSIIILNDRSQNKVKDLFDEFQKVLDERIVDGHRNDLTKHCGLSYDEDLREKFRPKLNCNSHQRILFLEN